MKGVFVFFFFGVLPSNEKRKRKERQCKGSFHFSPKKWTRKSMKEKDDEKRGKGEWGAMAPKKCTLFIYFFNFLRLVGLTFQIIIII